MNMNMNEYTGILIYLESKEGQILPVGRELIGEALKLARLNGDKIYGVGIGSNTGLLKEQIKGYPLEALYIYETEEVFQANRYEVALVESIQILKPSIVLIGATAQGRALAPRIAVAFQTGLTADCTHLQINEAKQLVQTRPAFGGNIMASILTEQTRPQIATVRPGIFMSAAKDSSLLGNREISAYSDVCTIVEKKLYAHGHRAEIIEIHKSAERQNIAQQELLVAVGRGVKKKEDLDALRILAEQMGGKLVSSRALVEKGWMKPEDQIGLSGNTVSPKCMLTLGVSGTVQFMAGMKNTHNIIAVDSNPQARIFDLAHIPICADLYEIIPQLVRLIS